MENPMKLYRPALIVETFVGAYRFGMADGALPEKIATRTNIGRGIP
jgi:hypothetical protein